MHGCVSFLCACVCEFKFVCVCVCVWTRTCICQKLWSVGHCDTSLILSNFCRSTSPTIKYPLIMSCSRSHHHTHTYTHTNTPLSVLRGPCVRHLPVKTNTRWTPQCTLHLLPLAIRLHCSACSAEGRMFGLALTRATTWCLGAIVTFLKRKLQKKW